MSEEKKNQNQKEDNEKILSDLILAEDKSFEVLRKLSEETSEVSNFSNEEIEKFKEINKKKMAKLGLEKD